MQEECQRKFRIPHPALNRFLLFKEAGFEDDAAAVDFAVNLFGVFGEANAFHFCATLDYH